MMMTLISKLFSNDRQDAGPATPVPATFGCSNFRFSSSQFVDLLFHIIDFI